jgi:transposase
MASNEKPAPMTSEQINTAIVEMFMEGTTYREMSITLGLGEGSISNRIRRLRDAGVNLPARDPRISVDQVARLNSIIVNSRSKQS